MDHKHSIGAKLMFTPTKDGMHGGLVTIVRPLTEEEVDEEVGPMYEVEYTDGKSADAFEDELAEVPKAQFRISMTQTVTGHRGYTEEEMVELGFPAEMFTGDHPSITVAMEESLYDNFETKQALEELLERDGDVGTETITIWAPGRVYNHVPRADDSAEPGDRCKDCGEDITWVGPQYDNYLHVDDIENQ